MQETADLVTERDRDPAVGRSRHLCADYRRRPPDPDWDGISRMMTK